MSDRGDAPYKTIGGKTVRIHTQSSLQRLELRALITHAQLLKTLIGIQRIESAIPDVREDLVLWIIRHQSLLDTGLSPSVVSGRSLSSPMHPDTASLANAEMAIDGLSRAHQTKKYILAEEHSRHAAQLARQNPLMAAAILREINDGIQKFHDGVYMGDLWQSHKALAEDIYKELNRDKDGSFLPYKSKFLNFSIVIGNIGFSGDIPCFRYKVAYPEKWTHIFEFCWVSVFFTLKEAELKMLVGDSSPYQHNLDWDSAAERIMASETGLLAAEVHATNKAMKAEERLLEAELAVDESLLGRKGRTSKFILAESHSTQAQQLMKAHPAIAEAILDEIDVGIQKFHDGAYGGDLFLAEKKLAEDIDKELHRDKKGSLVLYRDKFLNFSVIIGNMAYMGDIPCFRYKVAYPKKWAFQYPGSIYETAYVSVFYTLKDAEVKRLVGGYSA